MKNSAFTLAEVLITLAVIGIVAAMTIPTLINKYQEKVTVTKVKKMYSTLNQAVKLAEVDNGPVATWNLPGYTNGGSQMFYSYLKPYLRVTKECVYDNSANCLDTKAKFTYLNGEAWTGFSDTATGYGSNRYVRIILADGSLVWFRVPPSDKDWCTHPDGGDGGTPICAIFWYDINGNYRPPNSLGKDIFSFYLTSKGITPHEIYNAEGWGCSKWILEHDNMDYPKTKQ